MGTWGVKLYQNDIGEDVRDFYKDQLRRGIIGEDITKKLIESYNDEINDEEDAPDFWFALADTQWMLGRLEELVKDKALFHIENGSGIRRWENEPIKELRERQKVLIDLKQRLNSPQPLESKINQYKLYKCEWSIGDVYAYPLNSESAQKTGVFGKYLLFHKIGETMCWPGHTIPVVRVKITKDDALPQSVNAFNELDYVQISTGLCSSITQEYSGKILVDGQEVNEFVTDKFGELPEYRLALYNTSKRIIPKKLIYLGNYQDVMPPKLEFIAGDDRCSGFMWKYFDDSILKRYSYYANR